jgi:hypothetical protein
MHVSAEAEGSEERVRGRKGEKEKVRIINCIAIQLKNVAKV